MIASAVSLEMLVNVGKLAKFQVFFLFFFFFFPLCVSLGMLLVVATMTKMIWLFLDLNMGLTGFLRKSVSWAASLMMEMLSIGSTQLRTTSHMWQPSTRNVASVNEKHNFWNITSFIYKWKFKKPHGELVTTCLVALPQRIWERGEACLLWTTWAKGSTCCRN